MVVVEDGNAVLAEPHVNLHPVGSALQGAGNAAQAIRGQGIGRVKKARPGVSDNQRNPGRPGADAGGIKGEWARFPSSFRPGTQQPRSHCPHTRN
ncbi:hypothetical protein GCM10011378_28250 [Hymenobacter glacieicola]|uniref:Uncharacterized protein n=1 Tax=Hymenobacter glacieicola TaxID=1562124 RepID=A0ABQ1WZA1_9BACT|nr:hypothetical protein GCM10011378_28250 [Hymenobacter glacieicola]